MSNNKPQPERWRRAYSMREEGMTYTAIASEFGVSINRVRTMIDRWKGELRLRIIGKGKYLSI